MNDKKQVWKILHNSLDFYNYASTFVKKSISAERRHSFPCCSHSLNSIIFVEQNKICSIWNTCVWKCVLAWCFGFSCVFFCIFRKSFLWDSQHIEPNLRNSIIFYYSREIRVVTTWADDFTDFPFDKMEIIDYKLEFL